MTTPERSFILKGPDLFQLGDQEHMNHQVGIMTKYWGFRRHGVPFVLPDGAGYYWAANLNSVEQALPMLVAVVPVGTTSKNVADQGSWFHGALPVMVIPGLSPNELKDAMIEAACYGPKTFAGAALDLTMAYNNLSTVSHYSSRFQDQT